MERYDFKAKTSNSDIIIGITFPALLMLPILGVNLALFYLGPDNFIKENPMLLYLILLVCLAGGFLLVKKIQKGLII